MQTTPPAPPPTATIELAADRKPRSAWELLEPLTQALDLIEEESQKAVDAEVLLAAKELLSHLGCNRLMSGGEKPSEFGAPLAPKTPHAWFVLEWLVTDLDRALLGNTSPGDFAEKARTLVDALSPLIFSASGAAIDELREAVTKVKQVPAQEVDALHAQLRSFYYAIQRESGKPQNQNATAQRQLEEASDAITKLLLSVREELYTKPAQQDEGNNEVPEPVTRTRAKAEVARRRPPSKQPGYVEPGRAGKVTLAAFVTPELRASINEAAKQRGMTTQEFLTEVLTAVVAEHQGNKQMQLPEVATKERAAVRKAALQLAAALR